MAFTDRLHNRGSISTGFNIDHSLKVENDNREYIRWTNFSNQGSEARKKKFSMSLWCKRTELGRQQIIWSTSQNGYLGFDAGDTVVWYQQYGGGQLGLRTTRVFRDTAAWYHFMIVVDTAQSTEANRVKMYVNGVQETVFGTPNSYPSQNAQASNLYEQHLILGEWGGGSTGFSGYIAEYYFLSEIAASPTDLGEYDEDSGIWKPKAYDGTISSPSHFLEFKDGSDLGTATSGLDGDYLENITAADQATDTPTNNFAVLNFNHRNSGTSGFSNNPILTEGATVHTSTLADYWQTSIPTIGVTSGKWYFEAKIQDSNTTLVAVGMGDEGDIQTWGVNNGYLGAGKSLSYGSGSSAYTHSNIIGIAVDVDNGKVYWAKDNTYINSGNPAGNANGTAIPTGGVSNGTYFLGVSGYKLSGHAVWQVNFGGYTAMSISSAASDANGYGTFEYAPPSGYYAICTKNLAEYG